MKIVEFNVEIDFTMAIKLTLLESDTTENLNSFLEHDLWFLVC